MWRDYRAPCRPFDTGCRQCGKMITRGRAYCSGECSDTFQRNHFWNMARWQAIRASMGADEKDAAGRYLTYDERAVCARCGGPARGIRHPETVEDGRTFAASYWAPEVNHIRPLNGDRPDFGCCHHQDNLECVCHPCHVALGIEQRAAGLIGETETANPDGVLRMTPWVGHLSLLRKTQK